MTGLIIALIFIAYLILAAFFAFEEIDWTDLEISYDDKGNRSSEEGDRSSDSAMLEQDKYRNGSPSERV